MGTDSPEMQHTRPSGQDVVELLVRLDGARRGVTAQSEIGSATTRLLWILTECGPLTLRQIAETLGLEQSTVNRQVNGILREGLVVRERNEGESAARVVLTEPGRIAFENVSREIIGVYDAALVGLGDDATDFVRLLRAFIDRYDQAAKQPRER